MTQQVAHARVLIPSTVAGIDTSSFSLTLEATGSDTGLDFSTSQTPQAMIENFINGTVGVQVNPLSHYMAASLDHSSNACSIIWTDVTAHLDGSPAGSPFRIDHFTLGASASASDLPAGVCVCFGLRGDYGTDIEHGANATLPSTDSAIDQGAPATHTGRTRPRARDRGRFYLGPLCGSGTLGTGSALATQLLDDAEIAVNGAIQTHNTVSANQFNVVVWSRRNASVMPATFFYVNENFAYQRRRADVAIDRVHSWIARS